jgi:hypothetical protein
LTLDKLSGKSDLEKRFLNPFVLRVFGDYLNLEFEYDRQTNTIRSNIEVIEFYFPPRKFVNNTKASQTM